MNSEQLSERPDIEEKSFSANKTIFHSGDKNTSQRFLDVSISNHSLRMDRQDFSVSCELINGDYEYEVSVWNVPTEELMKALELCNEEQLMEYIEENFSNSDGLDELMEIIYTHHIPHDVWAG